MTCNRLCQDKPVSGPVGARMTRTIRSGDHQNGVMLFIHEPPTTTTSAKLRQYLDLQAFLLYSRFGVYGTAGRLCETTIQP